MKKFTPKLVNAVVALAVSVLAAAGVGAYASAQSAGQPKANIVQVGCEVVGGAEQGGYANVRLNNSAASTANVYVVKVNGVQVLSQTVGAHATQNVQVFYTNKNASAQVNVTTGSGSFLDGLNVARGMCNG